MEEASTNELVNLDTLVQRLEMPKNWLRKRTNEGIIPCLRVGNNTKYNLDAVRAAILEAASRPSPKTSAPRGPRADKKPEHHEAQLQAAG